MIVPKFPLDYGKVFLFDELKFRAYAQRVEETQKNLFTLGLALYYSKKMQQTLAQAEVNRNALFDYESIEAHFGVVKQIYNTGWYGRLLAFFLKIFGFNPHK